MNKTVSNAMTENARVLLFQVEPSKAKKIERVCRDMGVRAERVPLREYGQKLGFLARIAGFRREPARCTEMQFAEEMLVFSGMTSELLDTFLEKYREASLAPVELKAVLTPQNVFWTAKELYSELNRERQEWEKHKE